ncbi:MAG TPA: inositol monophosphatase family protein [Anaerolineales bacterium]|nr:inositol monophosphatase family protein [Anaerolineales bacterium]
MSGASKPKKIKAITDMEHTSQDLNPLLTLAIQTAHEAGEILMDGYEKEKHIDRKTSAVDWVTEYDKASEELIVKTLLAATPDYGILGEEGSDIQSENGYRWIIDPLDGTNNYAHRFPMFCVSIALYHGETPLVGVVYDPLHNETFHAVKGGGAYLTTPRGTQPLHVSTANDLNSSLLATGFPYDRITSPHNNLTEMSYFIDKVQGIRRAGSAALDMAYVAAGRLDGFWEFKVYTWDMAAGRLVVEEAGGTFTHTNGQPITLTRQLTLLASNGQIHDQMLDLLRKAYAEREAAGIV